MAKKTLFISRAFPPITGGIENQNAGILNALGEIRDVNTIINTRGKKFLPIFLPFATIKLLFTARRYDSILLGDGVLSPLAAICKKIFPKVQYISIIHGLDITYAHKQSLMGKIYRAFNIPALKKLDKLIMVGNYTIDEAVKVGVDREKCIFIPNGYDQDEFNDEFSKSDLEKLIGQSLKNKKVILRIGRFVPHKGVPWFLSNVLPTLDQDTVFIAAGGTVGNTLGDSDAHHQATKAISKNNLDGRAFLLTNLPWHDIKMLYKTADLYISPNIHVRGSTEGFGINAIEAAASGCTVIASDFQGLKDAIIDGRNGFLVPHEDKQTWKQKIQELLADDFNRKAFGQKARKYTIQNYSWEKIAKKYDNILH